jgi:hypothetical protein
MTIYPLGILVDTEDIVNMIYVMFRPSEARGFLPVYEAEGIRSDGLTMT